MMRDNRRRTLIASARTAEGYLVWRPCGPPPRKIEMGTALQAITRSVSQCKTPKPQNQVAFFCLIVVTRKEEKKVKTYHACVRYGDRFCRAIGPRWSQRKQVEKVLT